MQQCACCGGSWCAQCFHDEMLKEAPCCKRSVCERCSVDCAGYECPNRVGARVCCVQCAPEHLFECENDDCSASLVERRFCASCAVRCDECCAVICELCPFSKCERCERNCCGACLDEAQPEYCEMCVVEEALETARSQSKRRKRNVIRVSREFLSGVGLAVVP